MPEENGVEVWYRYHDVQYAGWVNEYDQVVGKGPIGIILETFEVERRTPKGVWLVRQGLGPFTLEPRFCLLEARKRFACPTKKEALESFLARKKTQLRILNSQRDRTLAVIHYVETQSGLFKERSHVQFYVDSFS